MKPCLLALLLFMFFNSIGQAQPDSLGFTNKAEAKNLMVNGLKEGKWWESIPVVNLDSTKFYDLTIYKSGIPYGIVNRYYNCKLWQKIPYKNGLKNGVEKYYFESGKLEEERPYISGKKNGLEKYYYENGKLKEEDLLKDDTLNGISRSYYQNGQLDCESFYSNGKRNEILKCYYESGKIMSETPYIYDKRNGIEKTYYENSKLMRKCLYINDMINGMDTVYYKNGKVNNLIPYVDDEINGTEKVFDSTGELIMETPYTSGQKNGIEKKYKNGKIVSQLTYVNGEETTSRIYALIQKYKHPNSFNWNDSTLKIQSFRIIKVTYTMDGPCTVEPCYETWKNHFVYDTLINFLKTRPNIKVAVASHLDGHSSINQRWSQLKADYIKRLLAEKGIDTNRVAAIGYGNRVQIIPENEIRKLNKNEQWRARGKNTRIEIVITEN